MNHKPVPAGKRKVPGNGVATALLDWARIVTRALVFAAPASRATHGVLKIVVYAPGPQTWLLAPGLSAPEPMMPLALAAEVK